MAVTRKNVNVAIPIPVYETLGRLCRVFDRSQAKAVEIALRTTEKNWLGRMTEEEKQRYLVGELDRDEADEIIQRDKSTSQPQPLAGAT
jgi:hypothetical protein